MVECAWFRDMDAEPLARGVLQRHDLAPRASGTAEPAAEPMSL